jgi:hypothetical protein
VAEVAYTQIAGAHEASATFISTGSKAFAEVNGKAYELPAASTKAILDAARGPNGSNTFGQLRIDNWIKHPS